MTRRIALATVLLAMGGCGHAEPAKTYPVVGVVRKVDAKAGRVTIAHEAIPGFMDAMTMPFRVVETEREALEDLRPGDKVSATLKVDADHSELAGLDVTEPAPAPAMTLDLSGDTPTLKERPRKLEPGEEVPDFAVTTQDGSTLKLSDLRGKVVALTFIYTRCPLPDFCPAMDAKFAALSKTLAAVPAQAEGVRLLSISFDPEHDTPEVLAKHAKLRGARPPLWRFAVASHAELAKVAERLGLTYGPREGEVIHNLSTAVIGPDGRLVAIYAGSGWTPEEAYKAIRSARPR